MFQKSAFLFFAFCLLAGAESANAQVFGAQSGISQSSGKQNFFLTGGYGYAEEEDAKIEPSAEFLKQFRACYPKKEVIEQKKDGITFKVTYEVLGRQSNGICRYRMIATSKHSSSHTNCFFPQKELIEYVDAIELFIDDDEETSDEEYQEAMNKIVNIVGNDNICRIKMKFDETKELREKLRTCAPYEQTMYKPSGTVIIKVLGKRGENCYLRYMIDVIDENEKKMPTETYNCVLSQYNIEEMRVSLLKSTKDADSIQGLAANNNVAHGEMFQRFLNTGICRLANTK